MDSTRCGSNAGYQAHRRKKELICSECASAHRSYLDSRKHLYKGRYKESASKYAQEHPEVGRVATAKWRRTHDSEYRERTSQYRHARRARKLRVDSDRYTTEQVLEAYGTDCHICLTPIDLVAPRKTGVEGWEQGLHLDHVIPLFKGGNNTLTNVRPAHGKCNLKKQRALFALTEG